MRVNIAIYNPEDESLKQIEGTGDTPERAVKNAIENEDDEMICVGKSTCGGCDPCCPAY